MLSSKTDICNLALAKLGARRISSYEADSTVEAKACRLQLDHVIGTLLERHQWNFATVRASLPRLASAPEDGEWTEVWQLPGDCVRLIRISSGDVVNPLRSYAMEGRRLLTRGGGDAALLPVVYITDARPVTEWSPLFTDAVVYRLAAEIAGDVTQNPTLADTCLRKLESLALPAAQTADARQALSGENFGAREMAGISGLVAARFRADGRPPHTPGLG